MYEIYPLKIGESEEAEPRIFYLGDCKKRVTLCQYMWLIKGRGENILVDTGFIRKDGRRFNPNIKQRLEEEPIRQLNNIGVKPEEIKYLILTHGHWDHLSPTLYSFTNAQIFMQKREFSSLVNPPHPWFVEFVFKEVVKKLNTNYKHRLTLIDGEKEVLPGIKLFWTGGHTMGHQAVAIKTEAGRVILTGDVVFTYRNIEEDISIGFNSNLEECLCAMERIRKEADIIIPGHDPNVLKRYGKRIPR